MTQEKEQPDPAGEEETREFEIVHVDKVSWFGVKTLMATAAQALAATIVGPMTGRREIMAALEPMEKKFESEKPNLSEGSSIWIDYIADCGDGWNASHSVAWLAGRDALYLDTDTLTPVAQPVPESSVEYPICVPDGTTKLMPGKVMILGGDQVYPTASNDEYKKRFVDVLSSARFWQWPHRHVYALPGNHDWYDGLTSFVRLFCQAGIGRRWFGAWRAEQHRSYFALDLPHGWKLWALDMSLGDDLDPPQQQYFRERADELKDGSQVILCLPSPIWLKAQDNPAELAKLDLILEIAESIGKKGVEAKEEKNVTVPLILTGDNHYYARHHADMSDNEISSTKSRDYVICGGGGAFGLGTIQVPEKLVIEKAKESAGTAQLQGVFPTVEQSKKARRGVLKFPIANPAFSLMLAVLQMITFWLLATTWAASHTTSWLSENIGTAFSFDGFAGIIRLAGGQILPSVGLLLWVGLVTVIGFGVFGYSGKKKKRLGVPAAVIGALHGVLQFLAGLFCAWLSAQFTGLLNRNVVSVVWNIELNEWFAFWPALILAYILCGFIFGLYLLLSHMAEGMHDQEVFSAQGLEENKSFLRMCIDKKGLTVYPIGLHATAQKWKVAQGAREISKKPGWFETTWTLKARLKSSRLFDPLDDLEPHLIEKPFHIPKGLTKKEIKNAA